MVFAKLIFFPPKFLLLGKISLFQNTKKKSFGRKKINKKFFNLAKRGGPTIEIWSNLGSIF
jgi:hypothetical protein